MQIIDIQERDYDNHTKIKRKRKKSNHAVNKTIINNSCYAHLKKKNI